MNTKLFHHTFIGLFAAALTMFIAAQSSSQESNTSRPSIDIRVPKVAQALGVSRVMVQSRFEAQQAAVAATTTAPKISISTQSFPPGSIVVNSSLPYWTFDIKGSRDRDHHLGVMVGGDPFKNPGTTKVAT